MLVRPASSGRRLALATSSLQVFAERIVAIFEMDHLHCAICSHMCYNGHVSGSISVRDLRNQVSAVLRRVEGGERLTVTVDRRPVAEIVPLRRHKTVPAADALAVASRHAADRGLLEEVRGLLAGTTDDL